jgi:hypothetical protein
MELYQHINTVALLQPYCKRQEADCGWQLTVFMGERFTQIFIKTIARWGIRKLGN